MRGGERKGKGILLLQKERAFPQQRSTHRHKVIIKEKKTPLFPCYEPMRGKKRGEGKKRY